MKKILLSLFALALISSCTNKGKGQSGLQDSLAVDSLDFAYPVTLTHAKGMQVVNHGGYKELFILGPVTGDTIGRYILYPRGKRPSLETTAQLIPIPARTLGCL